MSDAQLAESIPSHGGGGAMGGASASPLGLTRERGLTLLLIGLMSAAFAIVQLYVPLPFGWLGPVGFYVVLLALTGFACWLIVRASRRGLRVSLSTAVAAATVHVVGFTPGAYVPFGVYRPLHNWDFSALGLAGVTGVLLVGLGRTWFSRLGGVALLLAWVVYLVVVWTYTLA